MFKYLPILLLTLASCKSEKSDLQSLVFTDGERHFVLSHEDSKTPNGILDVESLNGEAFRYLQAISKRHYLDQQLEPAIRQIKERVQTLQAADGKEDESYQDFMSQYPNDEQLKDLRKEYRAMSVEYEKIRQTLEKVDHDAIEIEVVGQLSMFALKDIILKSKKAQEELAALPDYMLFGKPVHGKQKWSQKLDTIMKSGGATSLFYICSSSATPALYEAMKEAIKTVR